MEKIYNLEAYGSNHKIILCKSSYRSNNTIAVLMMEQVSSCCEEQWATLTVNIDDSDIFADSKSAYIDTNNLGEDIIKWLVDNNIAIDSGIKGRSGFCMYPLVYFIEEALESMRVL